MYASTLWITITLAVMERSLTDENKGYLDLNEFLQPDDVGERYQFAQENDFKSCLRECKVDESPRVCYYRFHLEDYLTLSDACEDCMTNASQCSNPQCVAVDGFERSIITANRRFPGPSIQVCHHDRIIVDIINKMPARSTSIHWHGILQEATQYYDGVPMVTQCPILEGTKFRYNFYANHPGTFFWHSHDGVQKVDGLQGSIVIRSPKNADPNNKLYDYDLPAHVMFITDWFHTDSAQHFPGLNNPDLALYVTYLLINGRGRYIHPETGITMSTTPYTVFRVTKGKKYRFRIIGAQCDHCHIRVSVENHRLQLIATDGNAVKPMMVDYFDIYSGERYDFVLQATKKVKSYWIKVRGLGACEFINITQLAVLQYEGTNELEPSTNPTKSMDFNSNGVYLNPKNAECGKGQKAVCVSHLVSKQKYDKKILKATPNVTFAMEFGYYFPTIKEQFKSNQYNTFQRPSPGGPLTIHYINKIHPETPSSPLLSQRDDIPSSEFCLTTNEGVPTCNESLCNCINLFHIPLGSVTDFILIDRSQIADINHPFHLHGFAFYVMAMGYLENIPIATEEITNLIKTNNFTQSSAPILKDTIAVPSRGYAILRIVANNPGYWLFHCHFLYHHAAGMSMVFQVGDSKHIPPIPKDFPKCGNHLPPVAKDEL